VRSISVPVRKAGAVVAAMTVTTPAARTPLSVLKTRVLGHLEQAAETVGQHLTPHSG